MLNTSTRYSRGGIKKNKKHPRNHPQHHTTLKKQQKQGGDRGIYFCFVTHGVKKTRGEDVYILNHKKTPMCGCLACDQKKCIVREDATSCNLPNKITQQSVKYSNQIHLGEEKKKSAYKHIPLRIVCYANYRLELKITVNITSAQSHRLLPQLLPENCIEKYAARTTRTANHMASHGIDDHITPHHMASCRIRGFHAYLLQDSAVAAATGHHPGPSPSRGRIFQNMSITNAKVGVSRR